LFNLGANKVGSVDEAVLKNSQYVFLAQKLYKARSGFARKTVEQFYG